MNTRPTPNPFADYEDAPEYDDYAQAIATQLAPLIRAHAEHPRDVARPYHTALAAHQEIAA